jgi:predicted  nucleic acid-binding Zn-ribbon protein
MTTEQKVERLEKNLDRLADVQNQTMDLLGLTMEGERRLATQAEVSKQKHERLEEIVAEVGDKLNGLIGYVDWVRRSEREDRPGANY